MKQRTSFWKGKTLSPEHRQKISAGLRDNHSRRTAHRPSSEYAAELTTITAREVDARLWHRLRIRALEEGMTIGELLNEYLARGLGEKKEE